MNRICLLRLSALGDVTHTLAVVRALQSALPNAEITWIIGKLEHRLLEGLEGVRFIVFDKGAGLAAYQSLRKSLAGQRFDVLLHQQVALRANIASTLIKATVKIGFDAERSRDGHGWFVDQRIDAKSGQHVLDGLMSFLQPIDVPIPKTPTWNIPLSDTDWDFARRHIPSDRRVLTLCPVSSHPLRNWQPERYAAVADHAATHHNMTIVIAGGPSNFEQHFNGSIAKTMKETVTDLTGQDTLKELAGLLGRSTLVLAPDTGPMHIANAMGTPVLGLHAASNPYRSGAYHWAHISADRYNDAAEKFLGKTAQELRWGQKIERAGVMDLVTVDDVIGHMDRHLNTLSAPRNDHGPRP